MKDWSQIEIKLEKNYFRKFNFGTYQDKTFIVDIT